MEPVIDSNNQQDAIIQTITAYQASYREWRMASDPLVRASLRHKLQQELEELWNLIGSDLVKVARGWTWSNMLNSVTFNQNEATESLAMSMFLHIIESLEKLHIDPNRNVRALLAQIARRGMYHEHRRTYRLQRAQPETSTMGLLSFTPVRDPIKELEAVGDPNQDFEEELMRRHHAQATIAAIRDVWKNTLSDIDAFIVKCRVDSDPPIPFNEMAQQLGPGWTAVSIRQRWSRLIKRTKQKLEEIGVEL